MCKKNLTYLFNIFLITTTTTIITNYYNFGAVILHGAIKKYTLRIIKCWTASGIPSVGLAAGWFYWSGIPCGSDR